MFSDKESNHHSITTSNGDSNGVIIGAVIAALILITVSAIIPAVMYRKWKERMKKKSDEDAGKES